MPRSSESVPNGAILVTGLGACGAIAPDMAGLRTLLHAGQSLIRIEDGPAGIGPLAGRLLGHAPPLAATPVPGLPAEVAMRALEALHHAEPAVRAAIHAGLEAGGAVGSRHAPGRIGVVLGGSNLAHPQLMEAVLRYQRNPAFLTPRLALTMLDSHAAAVLAAIIGTEGPVLSVGAAAASGAAAIVTGLDLLRAGRVDACLVLGAMQLSSAVDLQALRALGALARERLEWASRPFDAESSGVAPAEMAAAVLLERQDATSAPPLARLLGGAIIGGGPALPSPSTAQELRAMKAALADAGIEASAVDAIVAHATGTAKGDPAEATAIHALLGDRAEQVSVAAPKAVTGHALTAAGVLGLIQAVLMLEAQAVLPEPARARPILPPLRLAGAQAQPMPLGTILCNAFGFGALGAAFLVGRS